jgi:hypothetical protein
MKEEIFERTGTDDPLQALKDFGAQWMRITGTVLLIIFRGLISLCFITCFIRISLNLKNDQKNRHHDSIILF